MLMINVERLLQFVPSRAELVGCFQRAQREVLEDRTTRRLLSRKLEKYIIYIRPAPGKFLGLSKVGRAIVWLMNIHQADQWVASF